jgi:hypothetical protein
VAQTDLANYMNVRNAQQFLDSFWPRFLANYAQPRWNAPAPEIRAAAREGAAPADEKAKRSTIDQMRDLVPKVPFKVPAFKR